MRARPVLCATLALVALTAAACGNSSSTSSSGAPSHKLSGKPIHVGLIANTTSFAELKQGAQIGIDAVNASGGVDGRPLKLVACDNQLNANAAAACARKMVDDPDLIATVASVSSFGGDTNPIFEKASVAGVGVAPIGAGDLASPVVFPITPGGQIIVAGAVLLADQLKAKKPGLVVVDTPTATALPKLIDTAIFGPRGLKLAATATVPVSSADLAPQAAALADTDGVVVAVTSQLQSRYLHTARQQGYEEPIVISGTEASPDSVKKDLDGANENLYIMSAFDRTSPGFEQLEKDIKTYDSSATTDDTVAAGYLSVKVFAKVAGGLATIDRASVLAAMNALKGFSTDGMTLPLDYTTPGTALGGQAPRLFDSAATAYAYTYKDGDFEKVGSGPLHIYKSS